MSRLAMAWCRAYTLAVPDEVRMSRRGETESFVWEAHDAGVPRRRVAFGAAKGALDDVRWCRDERTRALLGPVSSTVGGSAVIAGVLMAGVYFLRLFVDGPSPIIEFGPIAALVVLAAAYVERIRQRKQP